ncbi:hypothetical protein K661_03092 [Piscirickettsia salmonis LF-89 = ATCC VR-1361]|nr:hypothetical protein K661_03092 [Piscirickettsia salmonis LF-89 = ATCC VR-1361]
MGGHILSASALYVGEFNSSSSLSLAYVVFLKYDVCWCANAAKHKSCKE